MSKKLFTGLVVGTVATALMASASAPVFADSNVTRVSGTNRFETAAQIQAQLIPDAKTVFLATGRNFPDALSAGPAAAVKNGAILLVDGDVLPAATSEAIKRMSPAAVYAIGGTSAVSEAAFSQAKKLAPNAETERVSGTSRFDTSTAIAKKFFGLDGGKPAKRYLASGTNFPDALAGGALAGRDKAPLVLVPNDPAHENIDFAKGAETIVLGGRAVVSDAVYQAAGASKRYAGASRYATAKAILDQAYPGAKQVIYAAADKFPDALAAVPAAAKKGIPLYLSGQTATPIQVNLPGWVVGGTQAVADGAWAKAPETPQASAATPVSSFQIDLTGWTTWRPFLPGPEEMEYLKDELFPDEGDPSYWYLNGAKAEAVFEMMRSQHPECYGFMGVDQAIKCEDIFRSALPQDWFTKAKAAAEQRYPSQRQDIIQQSKAFWGEESSHRVPNNVIVKCELKTKQLGKIDSFLGFKGIICSPTDETKPWINARIEYDINYTGENIVTLTEADNKRGTKGWYFD